MPEQLFSLVLLQRLGLCTVVAFSHLEFLKSIFTGKTSFPKLLLLNITKTHYVWLIGKITKPPSTK